MDVNGRKQKLFEKKFLTEMLLGEAVMLFHIKIRRSKTYLALTDIDLVKAIIGLMSQAYIRIPSGYSDFEHSAFVSRPGAQVSQRGPANPSLQTQSPGSVPWISTWFASALLKHSPVDPGFPEQGHFLQGHSSSCLTPLGL